MELLQLRYFQKAAELESMTKAAAFFGIPQPAVSQSIARLERELGGVKLFDRRSNRLYLNENGQIFLQRVRQALQLLDDAKQSVAVHQTEIGGSIRILALENRRFVLSCVSQFAKEYPDVNFQVSHDFHSSQDVSYDLCTAPTQSYRQMNASEQLIRERIILAVHEGHPLAGRESVLLSELRDEKFITLSSRSSLYAITYDRLRAAGFEPHVPFICDDPYFVRKYISENMGVSLAPAVSWAGRFRDNTRLIPIDDPTMIITSYLLWDEGRWMSPAVRRFRDFLLREARVLPGNIL